MKISASTPGVVWRRLDFSRHAALQAEVLREQALLAWVEATHHELQLDTVRPLYRQFHPSRNLETLYGVGQDAAAVYVSFIGTQNVFQVMPIFGVGVG
jgi:hypothetical protein